MSDEKKESSREPGAEKSTESVVSERAVVEKDHSMAQLKADLRKYPTRPYIGVGIVIIFEEKLLLVKRRFDPDKGLWSIPGGHLNLGEHTKEGAEREAFEETGIKVKALDVAGGCVIDKIIYDEKGQVMYHYVLVNYNTQILDERFKVGIPPLEAKSDADDIKFVPFSELPQMRDQISKSLLELLKIMKIM